MSKLPTFTATITVTKGRGVLAKDGKTPFAAGTMFKTSVDTAGVEWKTPIDYSIDNIFNALAQKEITSVQIITPENVEYIIRKEAKP